MILNITNGHTEIMCFDSYAQERMYFNNTLKSFKKHAENADSDTKVIIEHKQNTVYMRCMGNVEDTHIVAIIDDIDIAKKTWQYRDDVIENSQTKSTNKIVGWFLK